jgi:4-amino-4-deoxychorismate lyase
MLQFIESIKLLNNQFLHLSLHETRFNLTRKTFYPASPEIELPSLIHIPENLIENQVYKYRILYDTVIRYFSYEPYKPYCPKRLILKQVQENYNYSFKYADRSVIQEIKNEVTADEDIILIKNGFVTDSSSANLVFSDGKKMYTPSNPLLKGTKRALYLEQGIIAEAEIKVSDISKFKVVHLINAMRDLEEYPAIRTKSCVF